MNKNSQQDLYGKSDMYSLTLVAITPSLPLAGVNVKMLAIAAMGKINSVFVR
ncbi:MAG: hypothetical protein O9253_00760 [Aquidulcibacter sp.]|jgi:hypothetical protein|nr:hypothetical protein [Aquidulcibacter sp.]